MTEITTQKPILDKQLFMQTICMNYAVSGVSKADFLYYFNNYGANGWYENFIASFQPITDEEYAALPFICEDLKPYGVV